MAHERLYLFDTTLRDGAQTNGVDFTLDDKLAIAKMLDEIGVDYVEGGYPGANPTDTQLFAQDRKLNTTFTAFGMTRRPGRSTSNDPGIALLLDAKADAICFVAKSWDHQVRVALETTLEENLAAATFALARACTRKAPEPHAGSTTRSPDDKSMARTIQSTTWRGVKYCPFAPFAERDTRNSKKPSRT